MGATSMHGWRRSRPWSACSASRAARASSWRGFAKNLRDSFKQGRAWASEPLPAIAGAPPMEAPRIPAAESAKPRECRRSSTIDVRAALTRRATSLRRRSRRMSTTATLAVRAAWTR